MLAFDGGTQTLFQTGDQVAELPPDPWPPSASIEGPWRWDASSFDDEGNIRDESEWWSVTRRTSSQLDATYRERYSSHLYSESAHAALEVAEIPPEYAADAPLLNGFEIVNRCFDAALARTPHLIAFGEDVGKLGDVNQGMLGLQEKYGELRVADTGIRECTIIGQAIGMAMRGLRPEL